MKNDLAHDIAELCDGHVCADVIRSLCVVLGSTLVQIYETRHEAIEELDGLTEMLRDGIDSAFHVKDTCGNA
jgi:hypothetical protein